MKANVEKIPEWFIHGIEGFVHEGEKYLMINGVRTNFKYAPVFIQRIFANGFIADIPFQKWMKKKGITKFSAAFDHWFFCKFGALDGSPDVVNGELVPDKYNHACNDFTCEMRGKMCGSLAFPLRGDEIKTLKELQKGYTAEEISKTLFISVPGMKSRIETLKIKFGARNTSHLVSKTTELGI